MKSDIRDTGDGQSILCVENDPDIGRLLVALLDDPDYPAEWVTNGAAGECHESEPRNRLMPRWPISAS